MHPHEIHRLQLEALRLENENTAFRLGHLTASFEHIIQQADELAMRRQLAWGRCVEAAREGRRPSQEVAQQETREQRIWTMTNPPPGAAVPLTQEQFQEYMASLSENGDIVRKRVTCADGFNISIQASGGHYCEPRRTGEAWYYEWELGYPTAVPVTPELIGYAEDPESPLRTVYGYVPTLLVLTEINAHGGIPALLSARKEPT